MKRVAAVLVTATLILAAAPSQALAWHLTPYVDEHHAATEGAFCRWWMPDEEDGYWMYNDCTHRWAWYPEVYWADVEHYGVQWL